MSLHVKQDRREFIQYSTLGILGLVLGAGVVGAPYLRADENRLRPPGAVDEDRFLALCIKCGQCLQVCPYHSIKLADFKKGYGAGTPYVDARERGCYLCGALPCVLACPTGALDHHAEKPEDVKMGIAVLSMPTLCLAVNRKKVTKQDIKRIYDHPHTRDLEEDVLKKLETFVDKPCTICADMCPLPNPLSAIEMIETKTGIIRPQVKSGCVGCGVCEELCPAETPAIVVRPRLSYEDFYINGKEK
ncbi:MAG: 4Fe-4S dicluster domain-containing protein [Sulfurospirillaceae bacterium]|nr:4Fe-4S dicluster domain-containing protein [Sulfurospirillaceae bacterium]